MTLTNASHAPCSLFSVVNTRRHILHSSLNNYQSSCNRVFRLVLTYKSSSIARTTASYPILSHTTKPNPTEDSQHLKLA
jgi:hypothetical protein